MTRLHPLSLPEHQVVTKFPKLTTELQGERYTSAHVVQVSNNPYVRTPATLANRLRLDGGRLG